MRQAMTGAAGQRKSRFVGCQAGGGRAGGGGAMIADAVHSLSDIATDVAVVVFA